MKEFKTIELRLIGSFCLGSGLIGLVMFLPDIFPLEDLENLLYIFPIILFGLIVYSGYLILIKEDIKGLEIGRAVLALQIINFSISGLEYLFVSGPYLFAGLIDSSFKIRGGFGIGFDINILEEANFVFRVNIVSLIVFIYLTRLIAKLYLKQELEEHIRNEKDNMTNVDMK